jgi:transcriptional repressor NrdR
VPSHDVGLAILGPLRELDEVAYLRFASVYRSFESLADFEREIASLRERDTARHGGPSGGPNAEPGADPERGSANGRVPERAANQT